MKPFASSTVLKRVFLSAVAASSLFGGSLAFGQVNGVGPSDPNLFDNVINVPDDRNFGDEQSIGDDGQTTQVNVSDDAVLGPGRIGFSFDVEDGVELNVSGGIIGANFNGSSGSEINVSGGLFGRNFRLFSNVPGQISGGTFDSASINPDPLLDIDLEDIFTISGGSFGRGFNAGSAVELVGGEFRLNGSEFLGDTIDLSEGDVFTGTFADGSAFVFDGNNNLFEFNSLDRLTNVSLSRTALPAINTTPQIVDAATTEGSSLREGQTLTLRDGGELVNFEAVNATFNLEGGTLRSSFGSQAASFVGGVTNISGGDASTNVRTYQGNELNLSGGSIGRFFVSRDSTVNVTGGSIGSSDFFGSTINLDGGSIDGSSTITDSEINITGGKVGASFRTIDSNVNISGGIVGNGAIFDTGSVVNIVGGDIDNSARASFGSNLTISGGNFGSNFGADEGSNVTISGGVFDNAFMARSGTSELIGGEFLLNGVAYTDSTISLSEGDIFTGVFQDGSAFIFADVLSDSLDSVTLTTSSIAAPVSNEFTVDTISPAGTLRSLRNGQTLTVLEGGSLANTFEAVGGSINVAGGSLGSVNAAGGTITLNDGFIEDVNLVDGGLLEVNGGGISNITIFSSQVDFTGGSTQTVNQFFTASDESTVNISGGTIEGSFQVSDTEVNIFDDADVESLIATGSEVNVSGGQLDIADVLDLSTINISGGEIGILRVANSQFSFTGGSALSSNGFLVGDSATGSLSGGSIGNGFDVSFGAALEITGGQIGNDLTIDTGSTLDISGGQIGNDLVVSNSVGNVSGGTIGNNFTLESGAVVNVSGGDVGTNFTVGSLIPGAPQFFAEGTVNISGGQIGNDFRVGDQGIANISGGTFGREFDARLGSTVNISGGEFSLNGLAFNDLSSPLTLDNGDVFTGTLEDGSAFIFTTLASDSLNGVNLFETSTPTVNAAPQTINTVSTLRSARSGETLTVQSGGELGDNVNTVGATLNVEAGSVGSLLEVANSEVNISGGTVGSDFAAHIDSTVNISGGTVGSNFSANSGSTVNISGGTVGAGLDANDGSTVNISAGEVGNFFDANDGSTVNITGGSVGNFFDANDGSTVNILFGTIGSNFDAQDGSIVNISGGELGDAFEVQTGGTVNISGGIFSSDFEARNGGTVNIFGTEFFLDGVLIDNLVLDQADTIFEREDGLLLSGLFADGTPFDFNLNPNNTAPFNRTLFESGSTLTITRVASSIPEPGGGLTLATMSILLLGRRRRRSLG